MNAMNQEDELLKQLFAEAEVKPQTDLTEKVMHRISPDASVFEYQPVISKKVWVIIAATFGVAMFILIANSPGVQFEIPDVMPVLKDGLYSLRNSFSFDVTLPSIPEVSPIMLVVIAAINLIGIYLIAMYKWGRWMFRS